MSRSNKTIRFIVTLAAICASSACGSKHPYLHKSTQEKSAAWGYVGDIGPEHWGDLSPAYQLAKTGVRQSPIDIRGARARDLPPVVFHYGPATINLVYNGHTIEEKVDQANSIGVDGTIYRLEQFHFHAPSEHTIDGEHADMEMHLVHKSEDGAVAVVAVMIHAGAENRAFAPVWDYLPTDSNRTRTAPEIVNISQLLPSDRGYFRYDGSFTTPPCTEGVLWIVLQNAVELSQAQIDEFCAVIHRNNRPVQPLNGRRISVSR